MKRVPTILALVAALAGTLAVAQPAEAQFLKKIKEKAKEKVEERVDRRVDQGLDRALDKTEEAIACAATDQACIDKAKEEGKQVRLVDEEGNPVEAGAPQAAAPAPSKAARAARPGEGAWENYDFVPGERVLFADDFSNEQVGNFPRRMEFHNGSMQVIETNGKRWLAVESEGAFEIRLAEPLPERFTIEFDVTIPWWGLYFYVAEPDWVIPDGGATASPRSNVYIGGPAAGIYRQRTEGPAIVDPRRLFETEDEPITGQAHRVRLQVDGRYAKLYLDEKRIANIPNADFPRTNRIIFHSTGFPIGDTDGNVPTLFTNFSVNAGGRKLYDALMADGRFVTQGILFDTGSDRIRPESTPTLKEIGAVLKEHPDLRILIEGHTDSVGDDAANLELSSKRAAAVKSFIVSTYGIDPGRLETRGLGETKPAASNDTAEGRQQNRRVELVRL